MGRFVSALAQAKPYYPGFRDLNLFAVAIYLIVFLYLILIATIAYRVRSTIAKLEEVDRIVRTAEKAGQGDADAIARARQDRDELATEYQRLTATAPGRWFRHKE